MNSNDERITFLKKYMSDHQLNQNQMAEFLGISRQYLNLILNKNKPITSSIALSLQTATQRNAEFWIGKKTTKVDRDTPFNLFEIWKPLGARLLVDHEIETAVKNEYIGIKPFKIEKLDPASYCLSIGKRIILNHEEEPVDLEADGPISLRKNQKVAILTEEYIKLPPNVTAKIFPTTEIVDNFLYMNSGIVVHPGYEGLIYFTLINHNRKKIQLKNGIKILRIEFSFLPITPKSTYNGKRQKLLDFPADLLNKVDFEEQNEDFDILADISHKLDYIIERIN